MFSGSPTRYFTFYRCGASDTGLSPALNVNMAVAAKLAAPSKLVMVWSTSEAGGFKGAMVVGKAELSAKGDEVVITGHRANKATSATLESGYKNLVFATDESVFELKLSKIAEGKVLRSNEKVKASLSELMSWINQNRFLSPPDHSKKAAKVLGNDAPPANVPPKAKSMM